uniref:Uncharacterized protein n=1 Tax=Arundo donax TaxID=35708 RepID=A0A0A9FK17_ARUDO
MHNNRAGNPSSLSMDSTPSFRQASILKLGRSVPMSNNSLHLLLLYLLVVLYQLVNQVRAFFIAVFIGGGVSISKPSKGLFVPKCISILPTVEPYVPKSSLL